MGRRGRQRSARQQERHRLLEQRWFQGGALILAALAIIVPLAVGSRGSPPASSPRIPSAKIETPKGVGNSVLPTPVSDLSSPPRYEPEPEDAPELHCDVWQRWLEQQRAANWAAPWLKVSAPPQAPASITAVRVQIYRTEEPQGVTSVMCDHGAGGLVDNSLRLRLDRPRRSPVLFSHEGSRRVGTMPGAVFRVGRGDSEYLWLLPQGRFGVFYEWGVKVDVVVDRRTRTDVYGTQEKPFRTWVGKTPTPVDFDLGTRAWGPLDR
ncbi:MAG: hypothetical protein M3Q08_12420 [Pseudomonadota bacterium]|nr:hypothetical protein [Pseudomonadota bacterium]